MILVDTSIWIDHLHHTDAAMTALLNDNWVVLHPFVRGEIMLGNLRDRAEIVGRLSKVAPARLVHEHEVATLVESRALYGSGIGWVDAHLLASTLAGDGDLLWTKDRRLRAVAEQLGVDATAA